jgi:S1-C subfamily serine protease
VRSEHLAETIVWIPGIARIFFFAGLASLILAASIAATYPSGQGSSAVFGVRLKSGTGFYVSRDGLVVTSAHVVTACSRIALWPAKGLEHIARIIASDTERDIALLDAKGEVLRYATWLRENGSLRVGEPVSTIGFGVLPSKPREPLVTVGQLMGDVTDPAGKPLLLIRANLREGNSGGPVIDTDGRLLGMVRGRDSERPELGVAVPAEPIERFLSQYGSPHIASTPPAALPNNITDLLIVMSVLVQCHPPS